MRCMACGAEMHLTQVVEDHTMMVSGYEHRTFQCSACPEVERRLMFSRQELPRPAETSGRTAAAATSPAAALAKERLAAASAWKWAIARLRRGA